MTKSPYEIRLDVLKIASDMISQNKAKQEKAILSQVNINGTKTVKIMQDANYTANNIITEAEALLKFVNNNTR